MLSSIIPLLLLVFRRLMNYGPSFGISSPIPLCIIYIPLLYLYLPSFIPILSLLSLYSLLKVVDHPPLLLVPLSIILYYPPLLLLHHPSLIYLPVVVITIIVVLFLHPLHPP